MKLIYTHANPMLVANTLNLLQHAGYSVQLRNQFIGGAAGDLSPFDTWQEVWIKDIQWDGAKAYLNEHWAKASGEEWHCPHCQESNPAHFEQCWHCLKSPE